MRILCISNEFPLPANSGGRVDVWRRLRALHEAGHTLALVCWTDAGRSEPLSPTLQAQLKDVCADLKVMSITRSPHEIANRLIQLWRWPSHVASRWISSRSTDLNTWAQQFRPDVVLLDGLYGGAVALSLSRQIGCELWYRSHNIEHRYMAAQRVRERRWKRRIGLAANCIGLEHFERHVIRTATRVFDISQEDAEFWRKEGFKHIEWVPTLVDRAFTARLKACTSGNSYDILYFGNLNTPNNVEAVQWFIRKVLPLVVHQNLKIVIAGSRPSEEVRHAVGSDNRITLIENPEDMAEIIAQARVLVNPMMAGSGVNLKSVEMLFTEAELVSTSVGVAGLSIEAKRCFSVADSPEMFASAVIRALDVTATDTFTRVAVRASFSPLILTRIFNTNPAKFKATIPCQKQ